MRHSLLPCSAWHSLFSSSRWNLSSTDFFSRRPCCQLYYVYDFLGNTVWCSVLFAELRNPWIRICSCLFIRLVLFLTLYQLFPFLQRFVWGLKEFPIHYRIYFFFAFWNNSVRGRRKISPYDFLPDKASLYVLIIRIMIKILFNVVRLF